MADFKQTSYQADVLKEFGTKDYGSNDYVHNAYYTLPDQFTQYENRSYNPIDFLTSSGEFNLDLINKTYRIEQLKRMKFFRDLEMKRLAANPPPPPTPLDLTVGQNLSKLQQTVFDVMIDMTDGSKPLSKKILTKNNRLFYLGLLLVLIYLIYQMIKRNRT